MPQHDFWNRVRDQFRLDPKLLHFGSFWLSSYPMPVRAAIDRFRDEIDRNPVFYIEDNEQALDAAARQATAGFIGGQEQHIVLTGSTTEGLTLSIATLNLTPADEILITKHEHYSAHAAAHMLARRTGASVRTISLYEDGEAWEEDALVERWAGAITPRTSVAILTWVHSGSGVRLPLARMGHAVAALNAQRDSGNAVLLCVDATHGFGALAAHVGDLHCDMFVSSFHKWLNGPHGTGFVHFSAAALARVTALVPSFAPAPLGEFMGRRPRHEAPWERLTPGGFHAFENRWAIPDAIKFSCGIGLHNIEARIHELASRLKAGLQRIDRLRLVTPVAREQSAGIICFDIEGLAAERVVEGLRARDVVASASPYRVRHARLTPGIYNSLGEVDEVLNRLGDLVRHTPITGDDPR